ncbi:hypothetical protein ATO10_12299 [Actibacterium atlanticum]|uniref:Uncharacterized protein n=1 Tax=Actibacterium atlanticum TaxID=1461693 RepID=A0A058ZJL7_9RHOB|nr:hypothetical protein [Actibacterium atlanticum]KCV81387.1 hypothetical protein ATO10_12299 [Actibacterium atlanticum]
MCVEIEIGNEVVDGMKGLTALMPKGLVLNPESDFDLPEDCCLCWVDVEETAQLNGFEAVEEALMYYVFYPSGESK